ncbi:hypothetical protein BD311DRAFT_278140 [Dichomitus squalens]|uniref:Uncharacterized protein n=1 Tax=Dichomitus squalens TaxID=114155 RepID=A0A4Q9MP83_9APHY|nr:hypothetical protein BD311DRAFT_278140 [Dichomitus squalens]TBU57015.1 hypothetical protein BD310DRAFT_571518 [Dichomitus squalens]
MLLSYLIIALSVLFAPLAYGRPAPAPSHQIRHPAPQVEPKTLLGRHYLIHEHREVAHTHIVHSNTGSSRAQQPSRRSKVKQPFAKYIADRSGDIWLHERRAPVPVLIAQAEPDMDDNNYVSHVGPYAYEPAPPPPPTVTIHVTQTSNDYGSSPSSTDAAVLPLNLAAANPTATPVGYVDMEQQPGEEHKHKGKGKGKGHKGKETKG